MKIQSLLRLTCATGALLIGAGTLSAALAADVDGMPVKAPPAAAEGWWYHFYVEVGGRFFVNNPRRDGIRALGQDSLAKFYEYRDLRPGPFSDFNFALGSNDGLYQIDAGGKNVGYDDQSYWLSASKAGEQYFNFGWDQTPHVYGTGAWTVYNGVGTNALTIPAATITALNNDHGNQTNLTNDIYRYGYQTDIGIRRDTASVDYRWTPTDAWDVRANYSNMRRTGTQPDAAMFAFGVTAQVPKPVADTTQNYSANGEYSGTSFWGKKITARIGYVGSTYSDDYNSYTVDNPFPAFGGYTTALMSLWPSNQANGAAGTIAAELPWKSRYVGTVSYNMMRQNDVFIPFTDNPNLTINGQPANSLAALPATSLNGAINTTLINNVVTTQINPDLRSKLSYRYYDFDNETPSIFFPAWVGYDSTVHNQAVQSWVMSYIKQNGGAELNWRPTRQWNVGAAYGYERYDWTRESVDATNEHSGKIYADYKPTADVTLRGSWLYANRRYENYDYLGYLGLAQFPPPTGNTEYLNSVAYRAFYLSNRDRNKAQVQLEWTVVPQLTLTPNAGIQNDDYDLDPGQFGMTSSHSWRAGIDASVVLSPSVTFLLSYMHEHYNQTELATNALGTAAPLSTNSYAIAFNDNVNTYMAAVDWAAIPDKLNVKVSYTYTTASDQNPVTRFDGTTSSFPDMGSKLHRVDAIAKYRVDPDFVHRLGWQGDVDLKLHYAWERSAVTNWENDFMLPYLATQPSRLWMAYDNPNYNVHMIMASAGFKW